MAFTVDRMDKSGTASSVWLTTVDGSPRRIGPADPGVSASVPRWSPDGTQVAIAVQQADSPLEARIMLLQDPFQDAEVIAVASGHPEDIMWSRDGNRLILLCAAPGADSVVTAGAVRYTAPSRRNRPTVTRPGLGQRRAYEITLGESRPRNLGPRTGSMWDVGLSEDGSVAGVWSADSSESGWYDSVVGVLDPVTHEVRPIYRPQWQLSAVAVSPTDRRIAVVEGWSSDRGRVCGDIRIIDPGSGAVHEMDWLGVDVVTVQWRSATSVWFAGWRGMRATWGWADLDGAIGRLIEDDIHPGTVAFPPPDSGGSPARDGRIWAAGLPRDAAPGEVVMRELLDIDSPTEDAEWTAVTRLSRRRIAQFDEIRTSTVSWAGADGLRIDGLLAVPGTPGATAAPLVIYAHGGPASLWTCAVPIEVRFLTDAGFAVLLGNPRGSVGRGQDFARANLGDPGGGELTDLIGGIDACAAILEVDTRRVGVIGGSYGGYLAACAAAMTDRVACAVMMYGHPDLLSARYGSNNPAFYDKLLLGQPGSGNAQVFVERSPIIHVTPQTAPTLLLHGAEDRCSPLGQAEEMYRALIDARVDTELVVYPGEGHGLHSVMAHTDCWSRAADWLDRYLRAGPP